MLTITIQIAIDWRQRTNLAIERTLLAYLRTSLTMTVIGITLIKLFNSPLLVIISWLFMPVSIAVFIYGVIRCKATKKKNKIFETFDE
ncbi:hypothetical protein CO007_00325 [Candidatus Roizmanbacteria bacterium CG_4_8_14_3_um_filter_36_10]|uniref:DUF202 domain-containing protein n=3 Tax=Candidatus Roizmaniibacteriota TaxID=1752723 RepID=A0A2M7BWI9_9BACT|nr:MAG: hypothetical protein COW98_03660 [Candidatus Roizmanbacteria bacterium CG22_combo_CG10-13_8_21_14_all_35_9]PIV10885.1 MAG: hypothetical protein COS50_03175 [Candidatus Roizmanbacteria bacterium CG03_land_8_20_14_0_80_35_26]PJC82278.1 MAG: hypothetical protein CO007_00325 [Candidatus Roizmanbacteria bacterium CG_4_8_14_3_um_filter_36_10]